MRWRVETYSERQARVKEWAKWFAWFPVTVGEHRAWLEFVERRFPDGDNSYSPCVEYRAIGKFTVKQK